MMRQYLEIKEQHKDAILFFRLGDFYEMFFDDAKEATRILHITLTAREAGKGNKVPMCGIPYHAADNYIARLIKHGRKVAICEQVEEPGAGKKLVKRDITRIITPGTFIADCILDGSLNNYILSLKPGDGGQHLGHVGSRRVKAHIRPDFAIAGDADGLRNVYRLAAREMGCIGPDVDHDRVVRGHSNLGRVQR
jgi:DNA mismatch repair ATPase MutS